MADPLWCARSCSDAKSRAFGSVARLMSGVRVSWKAEEVRVVIQIVKVRHGHPRWSVLWCPIVRAVGLAWEKDRPGGGVLKYSPVSTHHAVVLPLGLGHLAGFDDVRRVLGAYVGLRARQEAHALQDRERSVNVALLDGSEEVVGCLLNYGQERPLCSVPDLGFWPRSARLRAPDRPEATGGASPEPLLRPQQPL